ncbi:hypothetical protein O9992_09505 [Vibrio lentus]|nr:hypothetical protein [Vibrio lentus]
MQAFSMIAIDLFIHFKPNLERLGVTAMLTATSRRVNGARKPALAMLRLVAKDRVLVGHRTLRAGGRLD